jgi:hypothetical protein
MLMTDPGMIKHFGEGIQDYGLIAGIIGALGVMIVGELAKRKAKKAH